MSCPSHHQRYGLNLPILFVACFFAFALPTTVRLHLKMLRILSKIFLDKCLNRTQVPRKAHFGHRWWMPYWVIPLLRLSTISFAKLRSLLLSSSLPPVNARATSNKYPSQHWIFRLPYRLWIDRHNSGFLLGIIGDDQLVPRRSFKGRTLNLRPWILSGEHMKPPCLGPELIDWIMCSIIVSYQDRYLSMSTTVFSRLRYLITDSMMERVSHLGEEADILCRYLLDFNENIVFRYPFNSSWSLQ